MKLGFDRRIHLIGVGGVGMSAIAELLRSNGCIVSGSDRESSYLTTLLESKGVKVQTGHEPALIQDADLVVYSSAVRIDNPERVWALEHGICQVRRADLLGDLMRTAYAIGVSGTHGKTTTTSLIGHIFDFAGKDPTVLVGGVIRDRATNTLVGESDIMVVEADEYDRSFLALYPAAAVITNIDADHLDCYRDIEDITSAFAQYVQRLPFYGVLAACNDDRRVRSILDGARCRVVTYGISESSDYRAQAVSVDGTGMHYELTIRGNMAGNVYLPSPGEHNVRNSLAALAIACEHGIAAGTACAALAGFGGVKRRFEKIGQASGVTVIDDYAHHPGEIRATIKAARAMGHRRIIAVFQPHLYTRTRDHLDAFAAVLAEADTVVVAPIYKSREDAIEGVSANAIVERLRAQGHDDSHSVTTTGEIAPLVASVAQNGDMVVIMGAGDIWKTAEVVLETLQ